MIHWLSIRLTWRTASSIFRSPTLPNKLSMSPRRMYLLSLQSFPAVPKSTEHVSNNVKELPTRLSTFGRNLDQRRRILRCLLLSPPFLFTISILNLILTDSFSKITTMPQKKLVSNKTSSTDSQGSATNCARRS